MAVKPFPSSNIWKCSSFKMFTPIFSWLGWHTNQIQVAVQVRQLGNAAEYLDEPSWKGLQALCWHLGRKGNNRWVHKIMCSISPSFYTVWSFGCRHNFLVLKCQGKEWEEGPGTGAPLQCHRHPIIDQESPPPFSTARKVKGTIQCKPGEGKEFSFRICPQFSRVICHSLPKWGKKWGGGERKVSCTKIALLNPRARPWRPAPFPSTWLTLLQLRDSLRLDQDGCSPSEQK